MGQAGPGDVEVKAISLHRPWDLLVLLGWKKLETRTHRRFQSLVGLTIAIHSAKRIDRYWREFTAPYLKPAMADQIEASILEGGKVHGTVEVWDHRLLNGKDSSRAMIDCKGTGRLGLELNFPRILRKPIPVVGRQGIFDVEVPTHEHAFSSGPALELLK